MKTLHCFDAGFDCYGIIQAHTEKEVLKQATLHAREAHGIDITPVMADRLKHFITEEEEKKPFISAQFL